MNKTVIFLLLKAFFVALLIYLFPIPLAPDEAQYWTWSRALDFGYYSKPPGIAWQIFLTTSLFGHNELGVRLGAVILTFFIGIAVYKLAKHAHLSEKASFWSALIFAFSPLGMYLSCAATTDAGSILGLTIAIALLVQGIMDKKVNYFLIGLSLYFGALFKWTVFIFYPFLFLSLFLHPHLRTKKIWYALLIPLLAFLPPLYWNFYHEFATFKHVFSTVYHKRSSVHGNFFSFLAAQIALFSPLFFVFYIMGIVKKGKNNALLFCTLFSATSILYLLLSAFKKMQPNWAAFFYPPAMVIIGWYAIEKLKNRVWLYFGLVISLLIFLIPVIFYSHIPYKINPFRQNLGWNHLEKVLLQSGYNPKTDFLFSDTYQMTSNLSFYGPNKQRAYFFNLQGNRKNQFSYWPSVSKEKEKNGYFVAAQNMQSSDIPYYETHYLKELTPYCTPQFLGAYPLFSQNGTPKKYALIFLCKNYNGSLPPEPEKY